MDTVIISVPAITLTPDCIGAEVFVPESNVTGVLSDMDLINGIIFVGGQLVQVNPSTRVLF